MSMMRVGANSRDIKEIVSMLTESASAICNNKIVETTLDETEISTMQGNIMQEMINHYSEAFKDQLAAKGGKHLESIIAEDAKGAAQMFVNNIAEMHERGYLDENAAPSIRSLTSSIATTMRIPYEANYHRVYNTRTADSYVIEMESVEPTIAAPGHREELLIDALSPFATEKFITKTEVPVTVLTQGLEPGPKCKNLPLTPGLDPLLKVDRDVRVVSIEAVYSDTGEPIPAKDITPRRGTNPFFDVKENRLGMDYVVRLKDKVNYEVIHLDGRIDFKNNVLEYLSVSGNDAVTVKKIYFHANTSHEEHLRPITTGSRNSFKQFQIPTRPHIEVSMPEETRTDIKNGIHHWANTDIISYMTEQVAIISSRMEDERLHEELQQGHSWEANFSFEAPNNFQMGNLEWFKREFVPYLDQCALKMKAEYNIEDAHFRCMVSPYILRIIETDYSLDKSATEDSKGSGPINYSIGVKTSTAQFYLISSLREPDNGIRIIMQPNQYKVAPVRSYDYYRYTSFLTDKIRRSDNMRFEAIVYAERNLPVCFEALQTRMTIDGMYIMQKDGKRSFRSVSGDSKAKNVSDIELV